MMALFSNVYTKAQGNIILTGKVLDEKSNEPLAFASISIVGKPVGTVTNNNGEFDFYVDNKHSNDTLVISHVGYQTYKDKIANLPKRRLTIALRPRTHLLNEVVIREKNLTAKEIVGKAVRNLTLNYSTKPFCLEGFFREIEAENGKYVLLTEAAVDLYDKKFDGKPKRRLQESVDVREMRRGLRYTGQSNRDNIGFALADLLENNDVRYNRGMLDTARNTFTLDTLTVYNDRSVFGVSMINNTDSGMLYVDTETFGFLKISMERKSRNRAANSYEAGPVNKDFKRHRIWFRFSVEFENYNDKLYPRRMHESELNEFYDIATGELKITSIETLEYIVTNIIEGSENKHAKQLKYGMTIPTGEYHEDFWKTFNTLKLTALDEQLIKDLEKEISLEEQFKKH
jgi:hypothetical protein